jgi:hypothetical protein
MSPSRAYLAKKFSRPLLTKDGHTLRTIAEARDYMLALPDHRELRQFWQYATKVWAGRAGPSVRNNYLREGVSPMEVPHLKTQPP